MPLRELPYQAVRPLLRRFLSTDEDEQTTTLIRQLRRARIRGYLTPRELEAVCRWKSPRAIHHIRSNSRARIASATRAALATRSERERLAHLMRLSGVSVPMASSILTLLYPRRYGVIDIRVWQLLHRTGMVTRNPAGTSFTFQHWNQFLAIIRHFSRELGVSARDIERTLFVVHVEYQRGRLYARESKRRNQGRHA